MNVPSPNTIVEDSLQAAAILVPIPEINESNPLITICKNTSPRACLRARHFPCLASLLF